MTGNNGSDAFLFLGLKGKDVVTDFNKAQDVIIFGAGGDHDDLNLRQAGATLEVLY